MKICLRGQGGIQTQKENSSCLTKGYLWVSSTCNHPPAGNAHYGQLDFSGYPQHDNLCIATETSGGPRGDLLCWHTPSQALPLEFRCQDWPSKPPPQCLVTASQEATAARLTQHLKDRQRSTWVSPQGNVTSPPAAWLGALLPQEKSK